MKKLVMAFAIVGAVAIANASTVSWGAGTLYRAANAQGGFSTTTAMAAQALVTMNVYLVDQATFTTVSALDQRGIYDWATEQTATYSAQNYTTKIIGAATAKDTAFAGSTTYYSVIVAEYTDAEYGKMFMTATATQTTPASGTSSNNNLFSAAAQPAGWTAVESVPEPTSGLLLLLGVAGLALKRKHA